MINYQENKNDIIQSVKIDLTQIGEQCRDLESRITEFLKRICEEHKKIFKFEAGNKLVYETEVLIPAVNRYRINVLMVLGNPAVHSVAEGMFFSYEKRRTKEGKETWLEHRFWRALRDCDVLTFYEDIEKPTPENIAKINTRKRNLLLNGEYRSDFNIFLLPYFSFPTPASGSYNGVAGIRKIMGEEIFEEMKKFEFRLFKDIVLGNNIKNVICFQQSALEEIKNRKDDALKHVTLYKAGTTRLIRTKEGKDILNRIVADIKDKNKIG